MIDVTIDEAIKELKNSNYLTNSEELQIAEWLEELVMLRLDSCMIHMPERLHLMENGYNKAIDDLIAECENAKFAESDEISLSDVHTGVNSGLSMAIHFAEQLKAGGENDNLRK